MIIINAVEGRKICLGRIGENEARAVRFDVSRIQQEFPGAEFTVLNMRPSDPDAYPVNGQYISVDGGSLMWTLQSGDLNEDGLGECELKATVDGAIVKSVIWTTEICTALDGNGEPPEPWESWVEQVEADANRAEEAAEDSEAWAVGERGGVPVEEGDETYHNNAKYYAEEVAGALESKADKVQNATSGHFAALDASGNLTDSGREDGDYAKRTDTVLSTTLSRGRDGTSTTGTGSFAFGDRVKASGPYSSAKGGYTEASGMYATAEGYDARAAGKHSHAEGFHTRATHRSQHVFGEFNAQDPSAATGDSQGSFVEIVGNGNSENNRTNARTLDWNGNERLKGRLFVNANNDGTGGTDLLSAISEKAPLIYDTVSNVAIASVSDATAHPVKSLIIGIEPKQAGSGDPYPAGGGKNKYDPSNTMICTINQNGNIAEQGNAVYRTFYCPSIPAGTWTISVTGLTSHRWVRSKWTAGGETVITGYSTTTNYLTFTLASDVTDFYMAFRKSNSEEITETIYVQIESGSTATAWSAYSNDRPITGWDAVVLSQSVVNVWDEEWEVGNYSSTTGEKAVTNNQIRSKNFIPVKPNTTYYFNTGTNSRVLYYKLDKTFIDSELKNSTTFTTPADCYFINFHLGTAYGTTYNNDISINYPSTDTAYHAHNGNATHTASLPSTVFGGVIDWVDGKAYATYALATKTGNNVVSVTQASTGIWYAVLGSVDGTSVSTSASNKDKYKTNMYGITVNASVDNALRMVNGSAYCYNSELDTVAKAQTFYNANNLQIFYPLDTPIEIPLSGLDEISTVTGENNVWADSGDIVELTYACDTKGYIDKQIATLQALILENT